MRRPAGDHRAGVHEGVGRIVIDGVGVERADDAHLIGALRGQLGPDHADRLARVAPLLKVVLGREDVQLLPLQLGELLPLGDRLGHRLAVELFQQRLVIERVEVTHSAGHVEPDDALGLRGDRGPGRSRVVCSQEASAIDPRLTPALDTNVRRPIGEGKFIRRVL